MDIRSCNLDRRILVWEDDLRFSLQGYIYEPRRIEVRFNATECNGGSIVICLSSVNEIGEVIAADFANTIGREVEYEHDGRWHWLTAPLACRTSTKHAELEAMRDAIGVMHKLGIETVGFPEVYVPPRTWEHQGNMPLGEALFRQYRQTQ
jgi:hypothetical protein